MLILIAEADTGPPAGDVCRICHKHVTQCTCMMSP
jgi:hypothetical protein